MILIGTDEGIYRWIEGAGWPVFHTLQERAVLGLTSPGQGVVIAVDRKGVVLESQDSGLSWRVLPLPKGVAATTSVACKGTPPVIVAAVKPLGIFQRPVGGSTPRATVARAAEGAGFAPFALSRARGMAQVATARLAPKRFQHTSDAQAISLAGWTALSAPPASVNTVASRDRGLVVSQTEIRWLEALPGDPLTLFAAVTGAGLWSSNDGGRGWARSADLPTEVFSVRAVPGRAGHAWAATGDGARLTTDGGKSWEDRSAGLENVRHVQVIEVKPGEPDKLLAGCAPARDAASGAAPEGLNYGLYETANGGKTWTRVKNNFPDMLGSDTISDIRFDPAIPDNAVVALGSGEIWVTRNGGFYWGPLARQIHAARVLCATS